MAVDLKGRGEDFLGSGVTSEPEYLEGIVCDAVAPVPPT